MPFRARCRQSGRDPLARVVVDPYTNPDGHPGRTQTRNQLIACDNSRKMCLRPPGSHGRIGRRRTRNPSSSTITSAPPASSSSQSWMTRKSRGLTADGVWFRKRKMTTLGASLRAIARISPKSRSNVRTIRLSATALATMSGSGRRMSPSSRRWTASWLAARNASTVRQRLAHIR